MRKVIIRLFRYLIPQFALFRQIDQTKGAVVVQLDEIAAIQPGKDPNHSIVKLRNEEDIDVPYATEEIAKAFASHWANIGTVPPIKD